MFEDVSPGQSRDRIGDWVLRLGVGIAFVLFGFDKFSSGLDTQWVRFFNQVGTGQWFRYFTGAVEMAAGMMVLFPVTSRLGLALLAVTMAVASIIHVFIIHQPANVIITGGLCIGLLVIRARLRKS